MSPRGKTTVRGHALQMEGRAMARDLLPVSCVVQGRVFGLTGQAIGQAVCQCGAVSPTLPSTAARQRWHREHKADVRARTHG